MSASVQLRVRIGDDVAALADELADLLRTPAGDPFAQELVCVPGAGMQRWLAQRLASQLGASGGQRDGVCAGVRFVSVDSLARELQRGLGDAEPWSTSSLIWTLLQALDEAADEPWFAPLDSHLKAKGAAPSRPARRHALARRLAGLYGSYAQWRPRLLKDWRSGEDTDGIGGALPADMLWQSNLWRWVADRIEAPDPASNLARLCERIASGDELPLPNRLQVFAPTRMTPGGAAMIRAMAGRIPVTVWQAAACPAAAEHPLALRLGGGERQVRAVMATIADAVEVVPATAHRPTTLLGRIQADLKQGRLPSRGDVSGVPDASIEIHASHGPGRQVEVLREILVGLLQQDSTLEPRDVVVVCPEIASYAPLLKAAFGLGDIAPAEGSLHPGHRIRVNVADAELRETNPVIDVLVRVLALPGSRAEATRLLELCATGPVSRRFGFDADDLERLATLVDLSGMRWGIDSASREPFGMERFTQNTWSAGLNRMLLGVALDDTDLAYVSSVLPLGEVESSDVDLIGRFAEVVSRVRAVAADQEAATPATWALRLSNALDALTEVSLEDSWQLSHARSELTELVGNAGAGGPLVTLAELRAVLADRLRGFRPRSSLLNGSLTICGMRALQGVPHRVTVVLGLDEATFPRRTQRDGDDVLALRPQAGDPDLRVEDRQALLDALRCTTERLVVIYRGRDAKTNEPVPPPVPLRELTDLIDLYGDTESRLSVSLTTAHPLQPHSPRASGSAPTFDLASLLGARALLAERAPATLRFDPAVRLSARGADEIPIDDLAAFFQHPVRALLRERGGISIGNSTEDDPEAIAEPTDELPVESDGLAKWKIGDRMLRLMLAGKDLDEVADAELRRGTTPPDALGGRVLRGVVDQVRQIGVNAAPLLAGGVRDHDVDLTFNGGRVSGRIRTHGNRVVSVDYSRPSARHMIAAWIRALALQASDPDGQWSAMLVGPTVIGPLTTATPAQASEQLTQLIDLYREGLRRPLPLPPRVALAYARLRPKMPDGVVDGELEKDWGFDSDGAWRAFFPTVSALRAAPAAAAWRKLFPDEADEFGTLALRVYGPLTGRWPA